MESEVEGAIEEPEKKNWTEDKKNYVKND